MRRPAALLLLTAAASLAACRDDPPETGGAPAGAAARTGTAATAAGGGVRTRPGDATRARPPAPADLPPGEPLTQDSARRVLLGALDVPAQTPELGRDALVALGEASGADAVRAAAAKALAKGDGAGGYADPEAAAGALEALIRAGDKDAEAQAVALAQAGLADDDVHPGFAAMLAAVRGPQQKEARDLLVRVAGADQIDYAVALAELAPLRHPGAAERLHEVAADAEEMTPLRATAAAGLVALGDPRGQAALERLLAAEDTNPIDVLEAVALEGVPETIPWMRRLADAAVAEDENSILEIHAVAAGLVDARGIGKGTPEDLQYLRGLLGKAHEMADDAVTFALWALGDDAQAQAVADQLAARVADMAVQVNDEEDVVRMLDAVAARGAATSRTFAAIVDSAAALPAVDDPRRPDAPLRAWRVRVAAARAYLLSKAR